jgi:membrane protein implicated in regulation of membrane protease activity
LGLYTLNPFFTPLRIAASAISTATIVPVEIVIILALLVMLALIGWQLFKPYKEATRLTAED